MRASRALQFFTSGRVLSNTVSLRSTYGPFYGGESKNGLGESIPVEDPATGETLCHVQSPSSAQITEAIDGADAAFHSGKWSQLAPASRAKILTRVSSALETRLPEIIQLECLQTGRCIREMRAQLARVPEWLDYHAAVARTHEGLVLPTQGKLLNYVKRYPLGVVAQITPFNHPLLIAMKKIAPALAAGNSVIVKPSELAPVSVLLFAEIAAQAGIPPGVLNVLPGRGGTVGKEVISHPAVKKIDITAGTEAGQAAGAIAASKFASFTAELGGKAPILIFADADLRNAVAGVCFSAFVASGQTCVSGTRVLVQEDVYDEFVGMLRERVGGITRRIGSPLNPRSTLGPLISQRALTRLLHTLSTLSPTARILAGGKRMEGPSPLDGHDLSRGYFFPPTVVEGVGVDDEIWREELFAPVVVLKSFKTEPSALALANASPYSLGGGLWTADVARAHRVAEKLAAGVVWVNTWHRNDPSSPWGGLGGASGGGRENGREGWEGYTQSKSVVVNVASPEEARGDDWFAEDEGEKRYG